MASPFFDRLKDYYQKVAAVLRNEAETASIFPNSTDIGMSRERVYAHFLKWHLPSACNVMFGGFLFNQDGLESKQIDVIVTADMCPQFNFHNRDGEGKSFACVDGALAAVSLKSTLDSRELHDALANIASIPQHRSDIDWGKLGIKDPHYDQWPYKVIYSPDGVSQDTLRKSLLEFYKANPSIPPNRQPDLIHVAGKYCFHRSPKDLNNQGHTIRAGSFYAMTVESDVAGLALVIDKVQQMLVASRYIPFYYGDMVYKMLGM
jgi:hypothetical protein